MSPTPPTEQAISRLLEELSSEIQFPETPPLASLVRRRIETGPLPVGRIDLPRTRPPLWRPVLVTASVVVLALAFTLSFSVTARRAVADLLGIVGIHITFDDDPEVSPAPGNELHLGDHIGLLEASARAGFDVAQPTSQAIGRRLGAVYYEETIGAGGMVSLVYPHYATTLTDVDLLITQFEASVDEAFFKKIGVAGGSVASVQIGSEPGYWVSGEPHLFYYVEPGGDLREETVRLAGNVLLWEEDGITYRVEGARSLQKALRIAESLR